MGEFYKRKNPPGGKRGPKPEYFTDEVREEMAERGRRGALSERKRLWVEDERKKKMKRFLKNYEKHKAQKLAASKASKIAYATYLMFRKEYPWFNEACTEIEESVTDHVETKLMELIEGPIEQKLDVKGNVHELKLMPQYKAIELYLATKGKERGYGKGLDLPKGGIQIVLQPAKPKEDADTIEIEGREEK